MQIVANDKLVRSDTVQDLKEFNSEFLATQTKKGEQLVSMMPYIKKVFDSMVVDVVDLSTENDTLKNKIVSYDEKCLEDSKAKLLKRIDDEKRAKVIMPRMGKQMKKHYQMAYIGCNNLWKMNLIILSLRKIKYRI